MPGSFYYALPFCYLLPRNNNFYNPARHCFEGYVIPIFNYKVLSE